MYDLAIIGGGPAGLSAALYALRANRNVILFEGEALGGTLNKIDKIENYPGYASITGPELSKKMVEQIEKFNPLIIRHYVSGITKTEDYFTLFTNSEEFQARRIIYCGGSSRKTIKAAQDFKGAGVSYCAVCDGFFYKGKDVAILGNGYTAEEDAKYLMQLCRKVYLIGKIKALEGLNIEQLDDKIEKILGEGEVKGLQLKSGKSLAVNALFIASGTNPNSGIFDGLGEKIKIKDGRIIKNLYGAGDCAASFKQIVWACASGAKAASAIFKD